MQCALEQRDDDFQNGHGRMMRLCGAFPGPRVITLLLRQWSQHFFPHQTSVLCSAVVLVRAARTHARMSLPSCHVFDLLRGGSIGSLHPCGRVESLHREGTPALHFQAAQRAGNLQSGVQLPG